MIEAKKDPTTGYILIMEDGVAIAKTKSSKQAGRIVSALVAVGNFNRVRSI